MLTKCMKQSRSKGFTLTEVVLAIGVVAVLIVVFQRQKVFLLQICFCF